MRDIRVLIIVALAILNSYFFFENQKLRAAAETFENGYIELMNKPVKGKPLAAYVREDSVGVFKINDRAVACAMMVKMP